MTKLICQSCFTKVPLHLLMELLLCPKCYNKLSREEAMPYANGLIDEFLEDLENLPTEHVTWVKEHEIRKSKFGEFGTIQSSMIFLPEITRLKSKWEAKKNED